MAASKKPFVFFFLAILLISVFMFVKEWQQRRIPRMVAPQNRGIGEIFTLDNRVVAVFMDGRTCVWSWGDHGNKQADFSVGSGRAIPLGGVELAALGRLGDRQLLSVYDIDAADKTNDITIGWSDQDIHLRTSADRGVPVVIRRNPERNGSIDVEFLAVDLDAELLRPPVARTLNAKTQTLRDYAVCGSGVVYAAGADDGRAWLIALELNTGQTRWDKTFPEFEELTTVTVTLDGKTVWLGDRNSNLLTVSAEDGELLTHFTLLRPGETRPANNDYTVLNLTPSPDGRLIGCTIAPIVYVVEIASEEVIFRHNPGQKVTSRVLFSPDSQRLATTSLRADGDIRLWKIK